MTETQATLQTLRTKLTAALTNVSLRGGAKAKAEIFELLEKLEREIEDSELEFRACIAREI